MRTREAGNTKRHELNTLQRQESNDYTKPGIHKEGSVWYAHLNQHEKVPLSENLANNIRIALRAQEKIEEALMGGHRPGFLRTISMMNCRKTIFATIANTPIRLMTRNKDMEAVTDKKTYSEQLSGVDELMKDVTRIIRSDHAPLLGSNDDMQIEHYLHEHTDEMPCVVHIFNIKQRFVGDIASKLISDPRSLSEEDCRTKLNRDHTFLVLGRTPQGTYICFQKSGPNVNQPFEIKSLPEIISRTIDPEPGRIYASFIGSTDLRD